MYLIFTRNHWIPIQFNTAIRSDFIDLLIFCVGRSQLRRSVAVRTEIDGRVSTDRNDALGEFQPEQPLQTCSTGGVLFFEFLLLALAKY